MFFDARSLTRPLRYVAPQHEWAISMRTRSHADSIANRRNYNNSNNKTGRNSSSNHKKRKQATIVTARQHAQFAFRITMTTTNPVEAQTPRHEEQERKHNKTASAQKMCNIVKWLSFSLCGMFILFIQFSFAFFMRLRRSLSSYSPSTKS